MEKKLINIYTIVDYGGGKMPELDDKLLRDQLEVVENTNSIKYEFKYNIITSISDVLEELGIDDLYKETEISLRKYGERHGFSGEGLDKFVKILLIDIVRHRLLYLNGGIYVDTDISFSSKWLIKMAYAMETLGDKMGVFYGHPAGCVGGLDYSIFNNCPFVVNKGCPAMKRLYEGLKDIADNDGYVWGAAQLELVGFDDLVPLLHTRQDIINSYADYSDPDKYQFWIHEDSHYLVHWFHAKNRLNYDQITSIWSVISAGVSPGFYVLNKNDNSIDKDVTHYHSKF